MRPYLHWHASCTALLGVGLMAALLSAPPACALDDRALFDAHVSRVIAQSRTYGIAPDESVAVSRDAAWHVAVAGLLAGGVPEAQAGRVAGAASACLALLAAVRFLVPREPLGGAAWPAVCALALGPGLAALAWTGTSDSMAVLLVTLALGLCARRWRASGKSPLPLAAAASLGVACLLRVEFVAVWLALWIHALVLVGCSRNLRRGWGATLVQGLSGLLVIAIVVAPAVAWNIRVIGVPWPAYPGVVLTVDQLAAGGVAKWWEAARLAFRPSLLALREAPLLAHPVGLVLFLAGLAGLLGASVRQWESHRPNTVLAVVLVAPAFFFLLYPFAGASGFAVVCRSFSAALVLIVVLGLYHGAAWLVAILGQRAGTAGARAAGGAAWLAVAALAVLSFADWRERAQGAARDAERRAAAATLLAEHAGEGEMIMTDQPGWLLSLGRYRLMDLSGRAATPLLGCLGLDGRYRAGCLREQAAMRHADTLVLWNNDLAYLRNDLGFTTRAEGPPWIGRAAP